MADTVPSLPPPSTVTPEDAAPLPSNPLPPALESLLAPIASLKSTLGVLVLARETNTILRATGAVFEGDQGKKEVLKVKKIVFAVEEGMEDGDELRFLRIRTSKHELIITPDPKFILVVLHDPPL